MIKDDDVHDFVLEREDWEENEPHMTLDEAISHCHVRSAIYHPTKPKTRYWKNNTIPIKELVPVHMHMLKGWKEYDPREDDDCSLSAFND